MAAWLAPALMTGASFLSGLMNNRSKQTQTSMPRIDPQFQGLQNAIMPSIMRRLQNPGGLNESYRGNVRGNINRSFDTGRQSIENVLSARGLGGSPVAGSALARHETGRVGELTRAEGEFPLIERAMESQDMQSAMQMLNMGRGSKSTMASSEGGGLRGGLGSMATMLGWLYGTKGGGGRFGSKPGVQMLPPGNFSTAPPTFGSN